MSAANYNITLNQGEDFELRLVIKDETGTPINLTGKSYAGQIRDKYDSSSVAANFSFQLGNQVTDPGLLVVKMTNYESSQIPCKPATPLNKRPITEFVYDIEQNSGGSIIRILQGIVSVSPNVTR
jgi:hypothetical protein